MVYGIPEQRSHIVNTTKNLFKLKDSRVASAVAKVLLLNDDQYLDNVKRFLDPSHTFPIDIHPNRYDIYQTLLDEQLGFPTLMNTVNVTKTNPQAFVASLQARLTKLNTLFVVFDNEIDFNNWKSHKPTSIEPDKDTIFKSKVTLSDMTTTLVLRNKHVSDMDSADLPFSFVNTLVNHARRATQVSNLFSQLLNPTTITFVNFEVVRQHNTNDIYQHFTKLQKKLNMIVRKYSEDDILSFEEIPDDELGNQPWENTFYKNEKPAKRPKARPFSKEEPKVKDLAKKVRYIINRYEQFYGLNYYTERQLTYSKPSRKHPNDPNYAGRSNHDKYLPTIHIYQDTSGSISPNQYEMATKMLINLAKEANLDIVYSSFSNYLSQERLIRTKHKSKDQILNTIKALTKASGGTDFANVWHDIKKNEIAFIISDMKYQAPPYESSPKNCFYIPIQDNWNSVKAATEKFYRSTKHCGYDIRPNILY